MLKPATILLFFVILLIHALILVLIFKTGSTETEGKKIAQQIETLHDNMRESQTEHDQLRKIIADEEERNKLTQTTEKINSSKITPIIKDIDLGQDAKTLGLDWNTLNKPITSDIPKENMPSLSKPNPDYHRTLRTRIPQKLKYTNQTIRGGQAYLKGSALVKAGILLDLDKMEVLWAKDQNKQLPIASLTKIMTMLLAYEITSDDKSPYTLQSRIPVTQEAINTPPSKVDFSPGESYLLKELFTATAVRSANDAAELIADHLGGGKSANFVADMNKFAKELGMVSTFYTNPHGLPGKTATDDNKSTVEDLAHLCVEFRKVQYLRELVAISKTTFREKGSPKYMQLVNHNNLLPGNKYQYAGVNGIKTGFTNRAGSCVAATCIRDNHNLLAIILGAPSAQDRDYLVQALFSWGYKRLGVSEPPKKTVKKNK